MIFYIGVGEPHRWARADAQGQVVDSGAADSLAAIVPPRGAHVVAVVPGEDVLTRRIKLPARNRTQALAAAPYALEESLSTDVERLHFALLDWSAAGDTTVAIVAQTRMDAWQEVLRVAGHEPDALLPDYLLVPAHPQARFTIVRAGAHRLLIREPGYAGLALDEAALGAWWRDLDDAATPIAAAPADVVEKLRALGATQARFWDIGADFTQWLRQQRPVPGINLLHGRYRPARAQGAGRGLRVAGALLSLALVLKLGGDAAEYAWLTLQQRTLAAQIDALLLETFPDIKKIVNPRSQMTQRIAAVKTGGAGAGEFLHLLGAAAGAVPASGGTLDEINFKDNVMQIACTLPDFAAVDALKKRFEAERRVSAELVSSGAKEKRVSARFRLKGVQP